MGVKQNKIAATIETVKNVIKVRNKLKQNIVYYNKDLTREKLKEIKNIERKKKQKNI